MTSKIQSIDVPSVVLSALEEALAKDRTSAVLWYAPEWGSSENKLRLSDMVTYFAMSAKGVFVVEGQAWKLSHRKDYAVADLMVDADLSLLEKPCTNTRIDDDGICSACGKRHEPYGHARMPHSKTLVERMAAYKSWWTANNPHMGDPPPEKEANDRRLLDMYLTDIE